MPNAANINPSPPTTPLRIGFVVHTFHVGGLERCIARLANHLDRRYFQPLIFCLNKSSDAADWITCDDVEIVELRKKSGNDPRIVRRLAKELRRHSVHIAHSHNWGTLLETSIARRFAGVARHVHAERGMELEDLRAASMRTRLRGIATRWALNRTDAIVAVCDPVKRNLISRCGELRHKILVVPNGIDCPTKQPGAQTREELRRQLGLSPGATLLGSVGRLAAVKDFPTAVRAIAKLVAAKANVHFVLVGAGPEESEIKRVVKELNVGERVHLVGQQSDVAAWLEAMDIYLNVSLNEGMSQSVLEAMACGLPSVVTNVGSNSCLVGGDDPCGEVVPAGGSHQIAEAVKRLISNPALAEKFRGNAEQRFHDKYRVDQMVRMYENIYMKMFGITHSLETTAVSR